MNYLEKLTGKSIAVVGLGYVGSHLVKFLKNQQEVSEAEIFEINRRNIDLLTTRNFDYVFNCAGNTGNFWQEPIETVESNIQLNAFLLKECRIKQALVSLSSTRIYGFTKDSNLIFTEDYFLCQPHLSMNSLYDNAKKLMECLVLNTPRDYKKIVIRLSNAYGDFQSKDLDDSTFLKLMLRHAHQKEKLLVEQNLESTKDYIFVDDAIEGIIRSAVLSEKDDVYNIGSGTSYPVTKWADFLNLQVEQISEVPVLYSKVSIEKARTELGFVINHDLENLNLADVIKYQ